MIIDVSEDGYTVTWESMVTGTRKSATIVQLIDAFEAEPTKHGRWLRTDAYPHRIYCSECYATFIRNDEFLKLNDIPHGYCPNCGARMDEATLIASAEMHPEKYLKWTKMDKDGECWTMDEVEE